MAKLEVDFFPKCCLFLSVTVRIGQNLLYEYQWKALSSQERISPFILSWSSLILLITILKSLMKIMMGAGKIICMGRSPPGMGPYGPKTGKSSTPAEFVLF